MISMFVTVFCVLYMEIIDKYNWVGDRYYSLILERGMGTICQVDTLVAGNIGIPSDFVFLGKSHSIQGIGDYSFYHCNHLISVTIPSCVKYIGDGAFLWCSNLKSVIFPSPIYNTYIGEGAFSRCYELEKVTIPNIIKIKPYTFAYCFKLKSITIPNSVDYIGPYAFTYCRSLDSIIIPNSVKGVKQSAFSNCSSLKKVVLGENVITIEDSAFYNCPINEFYSYAKEVPTAPINALSMDSEGCILFVPDTLIDKYRTTEPWKYFSEIRPL